MKKRGRYNATGVVPALVPKELVPLETWMDISYKLQELGILSHSSTRKCPHHTIRVDLCHKMIFHSYSHYNTTVDKFAPSKGGVVRGERPTP